MAYINFNPKSPWGLPSLLFAACLSAAGCGSNDDVSPLQAPTAPGSSSSSSGATPTPAPAPTTPEGPIVGESGESLNVAVEVENAALGAAESTMIHLNFTDDTGNSVAVPGTWTAESPCSRIGRADIVAGPVSTSRASYTYTPSGCSGEDEVTFTSSGTELQEVSTILTVDADQVAFLSFVSAEPNQIAVRGSGSNEKSVVTFKVNGEMSDAVADQVINFRIEGAAGGVRLVQDSATTDANGLVSVTVLAGTTPNNITVLAEHEATGATATSRELVVASGLPSAEGFNLALTVHNPKAWNRINTDGTQVIAAVTDRLGNAVVDGTVVSFVSEKGGVIANHCQTANNTCTVEWKPDGRDPADGRARIFASVKGTEHFIDNNGNGIFDDGDTFSDAHDLSEPYSDNNANDMYDVGEYFVDSNNNGQRDLGDGLWNGLNCGDSARCADPEVGSNRYVHLGAEVTILMSNGDNPTVCSLGEFSDLTFTTGQTRRVDGMFLSDGNSGASNPGHPCATGNPLPAGTTVSFAVSKGTLGGKTTWTIASDARSPTGSYYITYTAPSEAGGDTLTLTIAVPGEEEWERVLDMSVQAPAM